MLHPETSPESWGDISRGWNARKMTVQNGAPLKGRGKHLTCNSRRGGGVIASTNKSVVRQTFCDESGVVSQIMKVFANAGAFHECRQHKARPRNEHGRAYQNARLILNANGHRSIRGYDRDNPSGHAPTPHLDTEGVSSGRRSRPSRRAIPNCRQSK
jgi:hypothetical protein